MNQWPVNQWPMLANHLWQSTVFAAAAGLLTLALRGNRAQVRYHLWLAASLKFLVPFSLLADIGAYLGRHTVPAAAPVLSSVIEQASEPFAAPGPLRSMPAAAALSPAAWIPALLCIIWAIGFVAMAGSWYRRWRTLRAAVHSAKPIHLSIAVPALTSPAFAEPGVFGVRRPVLLLPAGILDRLTAPEFDAILAHELCHVRRRDNLATAMHMAVEALFWFHPLVWWLGARLIEERERACDEEVLLQGTAPGVYAEGILRICELYLESPLACVSGVTGANLRKRIEAIMANRTALQLSLSKKAVLAIAGAAALAAPVVVGIWNAPAIRAQSPQAIGPTVGTAKFEVASIKPCAVDPGAGRGQGRGGGRRGSVTPGRLDLPCRPVTALIRDAYLSYADGKPWPPAAFGNLGGRGVPPIPPRMLNEPMKGSPGWLDSDRYTVEAKAEGPATEAMMRGPMMQALLEERFQLKVHRETREFPVYELTVAPGGARLQPFKEGGCMTEPPSSPPEPGSKMPRFCGAFLSNPDGSRDVHGISLAGLCLSLSAVFDRDVIDETGLAGMYDFHFALHPTEPPGGGDPGPPAPPTDIERADAYAQFHGLLPKMGLRLEAAKAPGVVLVIDHVERPSGN